MEPLLRAGGAVVIALIAALIAVPRISRGSNLSRRAKVGLWTGSLALLLWAALAFFPVYPGRLDMALLPSQVMLGFIAEEVWMFLAGLGIGIFFALVLSGAFSKKHDATS